jgi:hypothetical protein
MNSQVILDNSPSDTDWIITKRDDFGEPLLREPVQPKPESVVQRYYRIIADCEEALW